MTVPDKERIQVHYVEVDQLRADPYNPRRISDEEMEKLTASISEFGLVDPVIVREADRTVIGGHQRLRAARRLGLTSVPVVFVDLSEEQARLLNLALNRISGQWDEELLARLLADLDERSAVDTALSGFDQDEIGSLLRRLGAREKRSRPETFDLDAAWEEASAQPGVKRGDLFRLGPHRLLCGDAADAGDVERLMDGRRAAMAFTDPPYNVSYGDHGGRQDGSRRRRIQGDAMDVERWQEFVRLWGANLLRHVDGALYVCMSCKEWPTVSHILDELGGHWSTTIIWAKDRFVLGRADYQRQYEPIWYGWRQGARRRWCGDRDQGDVWNIPRPAESRAHPTMKPLPLVERALDNSSLSDDPVLDLFLGSGTTLIAAERTGRACYAMEIDPRYVRVALSRWQAFSGLAAEKAGAPAAES